MADGSKRTALSLLQRCTSTVCGVSLMKAAMLEHNMLMARLHKVRQGWSCLKRDRHTTRGTTLVGDQRGECDSVARIQAGLCLSALLCIPICTFVSAAALAALL